MNIIEVKNVAETDKGSYKLSSQYRGSARCNLKRKHTLDLNTEKNSHWEKAVAVSEIVKGYYSGLYTEEDIYDLVGQGIEDKFLVEEATKDILRLIHSETRKLQIAAPKYFLVNAEAKLEEGDEAAYKVEDEKVKVSPTFWHDDGKRIDVIFLRAGRPDVSQQGRKLDANADHSIELWYGLQYGKTLVPLGQTREIVSQYYFLRHKDDTSTKRNADFFAVTGKNVVFVSEKYTGKHAIAITDRDKDFQVQLARFAAGTDSCSDEECETCPNKVICQYQKSPAPFEKKEVKKKGKVEYSEMQSQIINFREGFARVIAKAGTGKTECMTERGARMYEEGIKPENMLFITFTDAAAQEMKDRLVSKAAARDLTIAPDDVQAMTFHKLGYRMIKDNYEALGFTKVPVIIDTDIVHKRQIIDEILEENDWKTAANRYFALEWAEKCFDALAELDVDSPRVTTDLGSKVGISKMSTQDLDDMVDFYKDYRDRLKEMCGLTFSDIEPLMNKIMADNPEYTESLGYSHIIVDEFQDSNDAQMESIKHLVSTKCFKSLMIVGDDNQSIYAFRHTSQENILNFWEKIGTEGEDFRLTDNRRSTPQILKFANEFIANNEERDESCMTAVRDDGYKPVVKGFCSKSDEDEFILSQIKACLEKSDYKPEDIAVIVRTKKRALPIAAALSQAGIPWITKYPMPLIENSRVQAAISLGTAFFQPQADNLYLNYIVAEHDGNLFQDMSNADILERVAELKDLWQKMDYQEPEFQRKQFHDMLDAIKGTDEIYAYFLELLYANESLADELDYIQNFKKYGESAAKKLDGSYAGVVLVTAHSSKGLEWPVVFALTDDYDTKRLRLARRRQSEVEEARRLLYVAMTRARDVLYVLGQFVAFGSYGDYSYDMFLGELYKVVGKEYLPEQEMFQHRMRQEMARQEEKAKAAAKALKEEGKTKPAGKKRGGRKSSGSGELSEEDKKKYHKLVDNASQSSLDDYLDSVGQSANKGYMKRNSRRKGA